MFQCWFIAYGVGAKDGATVIFKSKDGREVRLVITGPGLAQLVPTKYYRLELEER